MSFRRAGFARGICCFAQLCEKADRSLRAGWQQKELFPQPAEPWLLEGFRSGRGRKLDRVFRALPFAVLREREID